MAVRDKKAIVLEAVEVVEVESVEEVSSEKQLTLGQQFVRTVMLKGIGAFIGLVKEAERKYAV